MYLNNERIQNIFADYKREKQTMLARLKQDFADLDIPDEVRIDFKEPSDLTNIVMTYTPDSGCLWENIEVQFVLKIPIIYPFKPPSVTSVNPLFHPNISESGVVCLSIIREDWKPVYTLNHVIQGLISLFYHPSVEDPLNAEAAKLMTEDIDKFKAYNH